MPYSQFKLSLPSTWTTIDSLGDSVTEAIRSGTDLSRDALLRLESKSFSGHLSARDVADLTLGRLYAAGRQLVLVQAVDRDYEGAGQSVRIVIDNGRPAPIGSAFVFIAEAPEHVRSRVVPQLTLEWAPVDAELLKPEFDHVIDSFRFTPPATSLVD
ncbi:hypothetical protein EK0264_06970 [Epidermidibacterium keratini]|uniref:Uncharacterized protein n=1 Tax=Epidermidibacterium keratini TaxID=1891644 RepID=A0A7L4YMD5_9ACTN|nr:hypothetical protein [Epidermidibacterium keratini]QHC00043.1 hypothetical protein EK0264_06970 [Epidermidibacterium keratini]